MARSVDRARFFSQDQRRKDKAFPAGIVLSSVERCLIWWLYTWSKTQKPGWLVTNMGYATQGYWGSSNWESISWIHKPNNHPHDDPYPGYPSNLFSSSTSLLGWPKKPGFLGFLRSAQALFRWSTTWRTSAFQKPSLGSAQRKLFNELIGLNKHQSGIFLTSQNGIWYNGISMGYHWWDVINGIYHQQHWSVPTFMGHRKKKKQFLATFLGKMMINYF